MNDAREKILAGVRSKSRPLNGDSPPPLDEVVVRVEPTGASPEDLLKRFIERWTAVGGEILYPADLPLICDWIAREAPGMVVLDDDLPQTWLEAIPGSCRASLALNHRIFAAGLGITTVQGAIAETGTLILTAAHGRARLASLAPPIHLAVLRRDAIVPDLLDACGQFGAGAATVWITGPSKTADIEGIIVRGVHGPRRVVAAIIDPKSGG